MKKSSIKWLALILILFCVSFVGYSLTVPTSNKSASETDTTNGITTAGESADLSTNASDETHEQSVADSNVNQGEDLETLKSRIDLKGIRPNEIGEVMVIMYHRLASKNTTYDRTVESFKADLQSLYDNGFRTVSMKSFISGEFDVPAGTTPIVLTFDDGDISQFKVFNDNGTLSPDKNSVVGILDEFYKTHPDFGRNAVFYVNKNAFGEPEYLDFKLNYLIQNGYEIGNHTTNHVALDKVSPDKIRAELGGNLASYQAVNPNVTMDSLALPYGAVPSESNRPVVIEGDYNGTKYHNKVILLVGSTPLSPLYRKGVRAYAFPRVQSGDAHYQLTWWINQIKNNRDTRYISDGVKEIKSIPKSKMDQIDYDKIDKKSILIYDEEYNIVYR